MSVINVLMQLRKVCNHPNLFEPRPTVSSFITPPITYNAPFLVTRALEKDHFEVISFVIYIINYYCNFIYLKRLNSEKTILCMNDWVRFAPLHCVNA